MAAVKGEVVFGRQQGMNDVDIVMDDFKNPVAMLSGVFNSNELREIANRIDTILKKVEYERSVRIKKTLDINNYLC